MSTGVQKVIDLPHVRVLVVEVPEEANKIEKCNCIFCSMEEPQLNYLINDEDPQWINLPAGEWQILGTYPSGITEEQAAGIVEKQIEESEVWYMNYVGENYVCTSSIQSLRSLLTSNGLPVEGVRYAVLVEYK